jgi:hypothetical protein
MMGNIRLEFSLNLAEKMLRKENAMPDIIVENGSSGFMAYYVIIILVACTYQLAAAAFTAWLASKKGYDFFVWFFLGLFFGIISLLAVGFVPTNTAKQQTKKATDGQGGGGSK